MRVLDIPRSGKRGNTVWQRNRYGQYSYPAFIPYNPRTPAQVAVRGAFGAVSKRWRKLTKDQRIIWCAVARTKKSKPRLCQCGPLTGFLLFVKVNVPLANRGISQVDLPPGYAACARPAVPDVFDTTRFDQPPVGPVLFLRANQFVYNWQDPPQGVMAGQLPCPPPATYSERLRSREGRLSFALLPLISPFPLLFFHSAFCLLPFP